jgi:SPP1 gp7 family putative phage head morphogenesis protein
MPAAAFQIGFGLTFDEAVAAAERRKVLLPDVFYGELPERMRQYGFTVAEAAALDQVQAVLASLNAKLAAGKSFEEWKREALAKDWSISRARLELISRNHAQTAYMAGHWENFQRRASTRPFLMYSAINDGRTRPTHRAMSGHIAAVGDPIWQRWFPPCGHNCRCGLISLTAAQAAARGLGRQVLPSVQPDPGWGNPPVTAGDRMAGMVQERAKAAGPQFATVMDKLTASGYAYPPLGAVEKAHAAELREAMAAKGFASSAALSDAQILGMEAYAAKSFEYNAYLRGLWESVDEVKKREIIAIQAAIEKLSDGVERTTFRGAMAGAKFDRLAERSFVEGKVVKSQTFLSTSSLEEVAQGFGNHYFFVIRGRSAANVDGFYTVNIEHEYLFAAGTNFLVEKVTRVGEDWYIELAETTQPHDFLFSLR